MARPVHYLKEVRTELRKVNWPTRAQTIKYTLVVIVFSLIFALFFGALDYAFGWLLHEVIL